MMSQRLVHMYNQENLYYPDPFKLNDPTIKKEKELDEKVISINLRVRTVN